MQRAVMQSARHGTAAVQYAMPVVAGRVTARGASDTLCDGETHCLWAGYKPLYVSCLLPSASFLLHSLAHRSIAPHVVFTLMFLDALPKIQKQYGL